MTYFNLDDQLILINLRISKFKDSKESQFLALILVVHKKRKVAWVNRHRDRSLQMDW